MKPGDGVVLAPAYGKPLRLVDPMADRGDEVEAEEIVQMFDPLKERCGEARWAQSSGLNSLFVSPPARQAVSLARVDDTCCNFAEIPLLFRDDLSSAGQPDWENFGDQNSLDAVSERLSHNAECLPRLHCIS